MAVIHDRLFNFLLKVRDEYPELAESEKAYEQVRAMKTEGLARTVIYNQNCNIEGGQGVGDKIINMGAGVTVHGNVTISEAIKNSFNTIKDSAAPDPLKELLTALANAVQAAAEALPQDAAGTIIGDLNSLVTEATKGARKGMLKALGEQIRDVASGVANSAVVAGVTGTLSGVLAHFGITL